MWAMAGKARAMAGKVLTMSKEVLIELSLLMLSQTTQAMAGKARAMAGKVLTSADLNRKFITKLHWGLPKLVGATYGSG